MRATCNLTTGTQGAGKSLCRGPRYVLKEFLRDSDGIHWSNLPWKFEEWRDKGGVLRPGLIEIAKKYRKGITEEEVRRRIRVIPHDVILQWRNLGGPIKGDDGKALKEGDVYSRWHGPWSYFSADDLAGSHLLIDEMHKICPTAGPRELVQAWMQFLGELRHQGATSELMTQNLGKLSKQIRDEAETRIEIVSSNFKRDGCFNIPHYDWYQFRAKLEGKYRPASWQITSRQVRGSWQTQESIPFWMTDDWFACYDSFDAPIGRKSEEGKATESREWEKYSWPRLVLWFFQRNWWRLIFAKINLVWVFLIVMPFVPMIISGLMHGAKTSIKAGGEDIKRRQAELKYGKKRPSLRGEPTLVQPAKRIAPRVTAASGREQSPAISVTPRSRSVLVRSPRATTPASPNGGCEDLEAENQRLQSALDELSEMVDGAFALSTMTPNSIVFRAGYEYQIGETIDYGPYTGAQVAEVDYERRRATLLGPNDKRTQLRLGFGSNSSDSLSTWLQRQSPATERPTNVSRPLRRPTDAAGAREHTRRTAGPANDVGTRSTARPVPTPAVESGSHQRGSARRVGR